MFSGAVVGACLVFPNEERAFRSSPGSCNFILDGTAQPGAPFCAHLPYISTDLLGIQRETVASIPAHNQDLISLR